MAEDADSFLIELEQRERVRVGIPTLKVGYNRIHGYYIELGRSRGDAVPPDYVRRQTLKSAERYVTPELKAFETRILRAHEEASLRERRLYEALLARLADARRALQTAASALAEIDVLAAFAERAEALQLQAPTYVDEPGIEIRQGRHPVVERLVDTPFVANDLVLDDTRRMLVITGPNMGGKSTYMRQTAVIAVLAHVGSFVPAAEARPWLRRAWPSGRERREGLWDNAGRRKLCHSPLRRLTRRPLRTPAPALPARCPTRPG